MTHTIVEDDLGAKMKNTILCDLYKLPVRKRIQKDIFAPLDIHLHNVQLYTYRKQLIAEGLIQEHNPTEDDCEVEITMKGYEAIQLHGSYQAYCTEKKKQAMTERSLQYLKERNLRLKNLNIIVGLISFITGSITGILLSDPIRNILRQWLEGG